MKILVTGGAGYIGSHTVVCLLEAGYQVVIVDDLSNSHPAVLDRIQKITGQELAFYPYSVLDESRLDQVFQDHTIHGVIHFAAFKAVGESVAKPLKYYQNNIQGTVSLLRVMSYHQVHNIIFSSSATVYGGNNPSPVTEDMPATEASNPYGYTKIVVEQLLQDMRQADEAWNTVSLRYFNPIGAHPSGLLGEDPRGIPNNIMPYISQVAVGKLDQLKIFGKDYPTPDGTGVRDYIHVMDLALGHVQAIRCFDQSPACRTYNLGTGQGYSVLDLVEAFGQATGIKIPYTIGPRRPGDVAEIYADPSKAAEELGFKAQYSLEDMCASAWRWQRDNPQGYQGKPHEK